MISKTGGGGEGWCGLPHLHQHGVGQIVAGCSVEVHSSKKCVNANVVQHRLKGDGSCSLSLVNVLSRQMFQVSSTAGPHRWPLWPRSLLWRPGASFDLFYCN